MKLISLVSFIGLAVPALSCDPSTTGASCFAVYKDYGCQNYIGPYDCNGGPSGPDPAGCRKEFVHPVKSFKFVKTACEQGLKACFFTNLYTGSGCTGDEMGAGDGWDELEECQDVRDSGNGLSVALSWSCNFYAAEWNGHSMQRVKANGTVAEIAS